MRLKISVLITLAAIAVASAAHSGTFSAEPVAISKGGPSGGASVSGDNRAGRYVAFHSEAPDLVAGDTNGTLDVFVYNRRTRRTSRASVSSRERQANGPSVNPAVDGSVQHAPRCVAFQSQATNLGGGDRDRHWDIYVRDLRSRTTRLVSRGIRSSATDPAISGDCRQVAFTSAGRIYVANGLHPRRVHRIGRGSNPDLSLDGSALVWERSDSVWLRRRGRTTRVARHALNPHVSDAGASALWGVVYDSGSDVYMRTFRSHGGIQRTKRISPRPGTSHNGGITAYAPHRGIVVFTQVIGGRATLWYMNLHTGNIDDLAHAESITDVSTPARANYIAFSSTSSFRGDRNGSVQDVFLKVLPQ
jgi:Tol biopolymer transport system component